MRAERDPPNAAKAMSMHAHQGRSLGRGFRGRAPGPWGARPRGPRLAPVGPPRGRGPPTVAVLAANSRREFFRVLLVEIRDTIHVATSSAGTCYEVKLANIEEELEALENRLEDKNEGAELIKHLKRLGGVDAADHVKKSMAAKSLTGKENQALAHQQRRGLTQLLLT
ncbi:unnamed protein product [Arctogadus glacialis]